MFTLTKNKKTEVICNKCEGLLIVERDDEICYIKCLNCGKRIFLPNNRE